MKNIVTLGLALLLLAGCSPAAETQGPDPERIRADTEYLCEEIGPRVTGTAEERETCDWLEARLREQGFAAPVRTGFQGLGELRSENLMAVCNGGAEAPIVAVVAHYDTVEDCPGARDNSASVAILLELARQLGEEQPEPPFEVRMIFLGSEENGYHGAEAYVNGLSGEERGRHLAVFNMDISAADREADARLVCMTMGGKRADAYCEGNFLEPVGNAASQAVSRAYRELYQEEMPLLHGGESDHVVFHQAEIDAVNVCWRRVEGPAAGLPEEYHRPEDTPEDLDYETAAATGRCVLGALRQLAAPSAET